MRRAACIIIGCVAGLIFNASAQIDPMPRNLLELGYDQPVNGNGPQALYAYYHWNVPEFVQPNLALRIAAAPAYVDGELGIRHVITPNTDLGIGISGGVFGDYYYEIRGGDYIERESFDGHGVGNSLSLYHRLNPSQRIPVNLIARGGYRYSTFMKTCDTDDSFELPDDLFMTYVRTGVRVAGKEPVLFPELGMELSIWFERQWRFDNSTYGYGNDRSLNEAVNLYWLFGMIRYSWTNVGHAVEFSTMIGGSENADRFSAWRIGGVLPLVAEYPLILPGYYFQELSATRFIHFRANYSFPLDRHNRWKFMVEGATAHLDFLRGFEEDGSWHTGAGGALTYTSRHKVCRVALRYGYGFNAVRSGNEGAHSVGLLFQYDLEQLFTLRHLTKPHNEAR